MRRPRQTLAAALLLPLLAGCGGAPQASAPPTPDPTNGPTSTSPSPAPEQPPLVEARNKAGAEAAVRWFLESMTYAGTTGDVSAFRETFAGSCTRCEAIAKGIEDTYDDGGRIEGGGWEPFRLKYYGTRKNVALVDAYVDYRPQVFVADATADPQEFSGRENVLKAFQLTWNGRWIVGALDPEA